MRGLRPGLQVSPAIYNLMLLNGCADNGDFFYSMDQCAQWNNGILASTGLHAAVKE